MKKFKILPSILMLVLCVGILAVGIYAVSPAQNNVTGTISVIASNVEVEITAYSSTNKSTTTQISKTVTTRTSTPIEIYDDKLGFDGSSASNLDAVSDITLVLQIKNNSASKKLGAFFLKDDALPTTLTTANIASDFSFDGETEDGTITESGLVTAMLAGYTEIGAGATVDLVCTLSLNKLTDYDMNVDFTLPLVIHDYDSNLVSTIVSVFHEQGSSVEGASAVVTTSGNGAYKDGEEVTLTATATDVASGYRCTYTWYAKNAGDTWEEVGTGKTYTFTMSEGSVNEYKVVYNIEIYKANITAQIRTSGANPSEYYVSGAGEYAIGDKVTLTAYYSDDYSNATLQEVVWCYIDDDGSPVFLSSGASLTYLFVIDDDTPLSYLCILVFHPNN